LTDVYKEGAHFFGRFVDGLDLLLSQKFRVFFYDVKMISFYSPIDTNVADYQIGVNDETLDNKETQHCV
jgi:hypothetical protein